MGKNTGIARTRSPRARKPAAVAAPNASEIVTTVVIDDSDRIVAIEQGTPATAPAPALVSVPRANEFTVSGAAFKRALAQLTSVVDKRSGLPILANVLLRSRGTELEMVGTDLAVWLTLRLATGKGSAACGTTIGAHAAHALVKTLPEGEIAIAPKESHAAICSGPVSARLSSIPDRDFPKVPTHEGDWFSVDAAVLRRAIDSTMFSVCKDETRFHLNGAFLASDGVTLTVVTTDGHRLTKSRGPWSGSTLAKGIIVPSGGLAQLRKILAKVERCDFGIAARYLFVRTECATLAVKLTDADFPPYEQVIPKANTRLVTVDRKALVAALKRSKLVAAETRGARLEVADGTLTVATDDPDRGDIRDAIAADYAGKSFRYGLNPCYLLELLERLDDASITMGFDPGKGGDLSPCTVRGTDDAAMRPLGEASVIGVIMPMRI